MVVLNPIAGRPLDEAPPAEAVPARVVLASEAEGPRWDEYVASRTEACGAHAWRWRTVFEKAFNHETVEKAALRGERVCGVLPLVGFESFLFGRTLWSLPDLIYGGVVADDDIVREALVCEAESIALARRCRSVELRHVAAQFPTLPCRQHKVAMLLDDLSTLSWERLDKKVRNQIRKAQKSDLTVEHGGPELLDAFYAVFSRNMRDLGTPVYSRRFFATVLEVFPERAALHVVRLGSKPVAAGLTFRTRRTVEIPWASSVRDFNHLCPNYLLYWSVLESARANGGHVFDFGRSTPGEGTFKFKEQWGAHPVPLHWEYVLPAGTPIPNTSPTNPKYAAAIALWKRLPLPVANCLGPYVVRGIP